MGCLCGHGLWHRFGPERSCRYGYGYGPRYLHGYGSEFMQGPRRRRIRTEELEEYLSDLEEEIAAVKAELEELRKSSPAS